jgi:regulation of enolase protein 1 (concanavalin A-like superfamily)
VVTRDLSDWSVAPLPAGSAALPITIRASRAGDSVTLRYRVGGEGRLRLLRVAYLPPEAELLVGPMCCSPSRGGLVIRFEPVRLGPPDGHLHDE